MLLYHISSDYHMNSHLRDGSCDCPIVSVREVVCLRVGDRRVVVVFELFRIVVVRLMGQEVVVLTGRPHQVRHYSVRQEVAADEKPGDRQTEAYKQ